MDDQFTVGQVRRDRKKLEEEVQKLHNRIRVIQEEEKRVLKKVDEDRRRAKLLEGVKADTTMFTE